MPVSFLGLNTVVVTNLKRATTPAKKQTPAHHLEPWTDQQVMQLERLADHNTPTRQIAHTLGRTEDAVRSKASEEDISLKPTNQSPYGDHS